jgi:hypothetical protein
VEPEFCAGGEACAWAGKLNLGNGFSLGYFDSFRVVAGDTRRAAVFP